MQHPDSIANIYTDAAIKEASWLACVGMAFKLRARLAREPGGARTAKRFTDAMITEADWLRCAGITFELRELVLAAEKERTRNVASRKRAEQISAAVGELPPAERFKAACKAAVRARPLTDGIVKTLEIHSAAHDETRVFNEVPLDTPLRHLLMHAWSDDACGDFTVVLPDDYDEESGDVLRSGMDNFSSTEPTPQALLVATSGRPTRGDVDVVKVFVVFADDDEDDADSCDERGPFTWNGCDGHSETCPFAVPAEAKPSR